jgi:uncharacterized protein
MSEPTPERHPLPQGGEPTAPARPGAQHSVFFGPNGLRAGWRILIFVILVSVFQFAFDFNPPVRRMLRALQASGTITPFTVIVTEGLNVVALVLAVAVMVRIERRSFADCGLPLSEAFRKLFWLGLPVGFLALTAQIGLIASLHGYLPGGLAITGGEIAGYGLLYAIGFLLVGLFEEFTFRGYLQFTLASGTGFWSAAIILAVVFGALHLQNSGEAMLGALMAASFGLVQAFSLQRTGNLWFAIGSHAAWDWGETFFYSVPNSGLVAHGHLLNASFHGPKWLTGGSVGPEGSPLVFPILILWALAIHFMFPAARLDRVGSHSRIVSSSHIQS